MLDVRFKHPIAQPLLRKKKRLKKRMTDFQVSWVEKYVVTNVTRKDVYHYIVTCRVPQSSKLGSKALYTQT